MTEKTYTKEEMLQIVEENIKKMEDKDFNVYFFVLDTKGNASGSLEYIYETALTLKNLGYNVTMIHQEKEFDGVSQWLGERYDVLPHKNVETENVEIGPSDFLFIPEIFANVMTQTKKLPCKRIIILQNFNYLCEFLPVGITPSDLNIHEVITTTKVQEAMLRDYFPGIRTHVVSPAIKNVFRAATEPQKLIINVVSKNQNDINRIVKPFYWKYPVYKWISFRDLRGVTQEVFAEALREAAITIWIDDTTQFGYSALEALRCGGLVLAKVPQRLSDWNVERGANGEEALTDACLWFDDFDKVPDMVASMVRTWTLDNIPDEVYESGKKFNSVYTTEQQAEEIKRVYVDEIFEHRKSEFIEVREQVKNNGINLEEK